MITTLATILFELVDLSIKLSEILMANKSFNSEDKELFKARIREMQAKVTAWDSQ